MFHEKPILFESPAPFFQIGVQIANPVFLALFCIPEDFRWIRVAFVQFLGDVLPVFLGGLAE